MNPKRSKIRYFYYFAYFWMKPLIELFYKVLSYEQMRGTYAYEHFFCYRIDYKQWRVFMADMEYKNKRLHDRIIYVPPVLIVTFIMVLLIW